MESFPLKLIRIRLETSVTAAARIALWVTATANAAMCLFKDRWQLVNYSPHITRAAGDAVIYNQLTAKTGVLLTAVSSVNISRRNDQNICRSLDERRLKRNPEVGVVDCRRRWSKAVKSDLQSIRLKCAHQVNGDERAIGTLDAPWLRMALGVVIKPSAADPADLELLKLLA
jgi:hypothetical protein